MIVRGRRQKSDQFDFADIPGSNLTAVPAAIFSTHAVQPSSRSNDSAAIHFEEMAVRSDLNRTIAHDNRDTMRSRVRR